MSPDMHTHETPRTDEVREREVIITDGGRDRSPVMGLVVGLIGLAIVVVIALVGYGLVNSLTGAGDTDAPTIDVPSEVDINVPDDGGANG